MKQLLLFSFLLIQAGCAHPAYLTDRVFNEIKPGMSKQEVLNRLGNPGGFKTSEDGKLTELVYVGQQTGDQCQISMTEDELVSTSVCKQNSRRLTRAQRFAAALAAQNTNQNRMYNCNTMGSVTHCY